MLTSIVPGRPAVAVVERTDEPAAHDNPLTREIKAALVRRSPPTAAWSREVRSVSAGLGSRDVGAGDIVAVFDWLADHERPAGTPLAVLGIRHPLALAGDPLDLRPAGAFSLRGHSIGGFGSVTTNKLVATLVGELFGMHVQAYPRYGSEKKGLPTTYYLTHRRRSGSASTANSSTSISCRSTTWRRSARAIRSAASRDGGTVFVQSPLADPRRDLGVDPGSRRGPRSSRADPPGRAGHRGARPASCAPGRPRPPHAGRGAGRRLPPRRAVRGASRHDRRDR